MRNWKTTTAGVLGLVVVLATAGKSYLATGQIPDLAALAAAITAAAVGIAAKDNNARL